MQPRPRHLMDYLEFPILYVDDEPQNLRIFELTFNREFTILCAESGEEGMRILNEHPVAVILSDHKMPGMAGVEFLSRARGLDPKAIRMLVTAYGDAATLGEAINSGAISRYIPKPWQPDELRMTLRSSIETYALDREREALLNELTLLNRMSRLLHRELDLDRLGELLLATAHEGLGLDGAALLFFDRHGQELRWSGFAPDDEVASRLRQIALTSESAPIFLDRLSKGEPQVLSMDERDEYERPIAGWLTEVASDEILVVPLVGKDEVLGALVVDTRSGSRRFGADDRTLLDGLSTQAVIAIENARVVRDLRNTREQVRRADRLGTLGTLAAGLAHEINNPLVSIHTFLSLAPQKRELEDPDFWVDYHSLATGELERIRDLVETMSRLGRGGSESATSEPVALGLLAEEVVRLVQREAKAEGIRLCVECAPSAPRADVVRNQIHQVLLNLLLNAVHATPAGGEVRVRVDEKDAAEGEVCMTIEDTGSGIPEEDLERIFDPFFTTKDPDEGTGLGLMISHGIVSDHGGSMEVRSKLGVGSTFCVRLPAVRDHTAKGSDEADSGEPARDA